MTVELNRELVYDVGKKKWFEMRRGETVPENIPLPLADTITLSDEITVATPTLEFETYFELFPREFSAPQNDSGFSYMDCFTSQLKVDPAAYDGTVTWEFELIGWNNNSAALTFQVVDTSGTVCAAITLPGTGGAVSPAPEPTWELLRQRTTFTPTADDTYMVRLVGEPLSYFDDYLYCLITCARLICHQVGATKTQLQIPLMSAGGDEWQFNGAGDWPWDWPDKRTISDIHAAYAPGGSNYTDSSSIWKYDAAEIGTPSEVVYSVCFSQDRISPVELTQIIATSYPVQTFRNMLYWVPAVDDDGSQCLTPDPSTWVGESQTYTDGGSRTFTPVPDSFVTATADGGGNLSGFTTLFYPDLSGLPAGSYTLHWGQTINYDLMEFWEDMTTITIPPGSWIPYCSATLVFTDSTHYSIIFRYEVRAISATTLYAALWDVTSGSIVTGSELTFGPEENYARKYTSSLTFTDQHEYELCYKSAQKFPTYRGGIVDAQLLIKLDPIDKLTTWHRVSNAGSDFIDNYYAPSGWNHNGIESRVNLFIPEGATVYYEQTALGFDGYPGSTVLMDMGSDDSSGSGGSSAGSITWGDSNDLARKRSDALTLTDGNRYTVNNVDYETDYVTPTNGFIVIKVV